MSTLPSPVPRADDPRVGLTLERIAEATSHRLETRLNTPLRFISQRLDELAARPAGVDLSGISRKLGDIETSLHGLHGRRMPTPQPHPISILIKALACAIISTRSFEGRSVARADVEPVLKEHYPGEKRIAEAVNVLLRAAVPPASTTGIGWAAELVNFANAEGLIASLAVPSVYTALSGRGLRLDLSAGGIRLPGRLPIPTVSGAFIAEGAEIPVKRLNLQATSLTVHKIGVISQFSRELARRSTPSIEAILRAAIAEDTAVTLDAILLDDQPETSIRPPGLLNGVTGLAPSGNTNPSMALAEDLAALAASVPYSNDLIFISDQSTRLRALTLAVSGLLSVPWVTSPTVPANRVVAVDAGDFASAEGDDLRFEVASEIVLHESDQPLPLMSGVPGSAVAAAPQRSAFQTAILALRMMASLTWGMVRGNRVSFIDNVSW